MSTTPEVRALWDGLDLPETAKTLAADVSIRAPGFEDTQATTHPDAAESLDEVLQRLPTLDLLKAGDDRPPGATPEWLLRDELGRGGMGVVSRASQRSLARDVAVKHLEGRMRRSANKQALVDEARVLGALEHPNIVPVYALGTDEAGYPVMAMKRIEGVLWSGLLRDPDHPHWEDAEGDWLERNVNVLLQVCRAIEYAHSRHLAHRDLKPENVMLGDFGEVYVLDWGVACSLGQEQPGPLGIVAEGGRGAALVGTPCYMAPEMLRRAAITERTDVFLLGAVLHEILTGAPPHVGDNLYEVLYAVASSEPRAYAPELPRELVDICERALSAKPEDRFPTAAALREALSGAQRHRASVRLTVEALARLDDAGDETPERSWQRLWECRFGLRQALDMWPDNEAAHAGLRRCRERMVERALENRDLALARSILGELGADDALERDVEHLAAELERERVQVGQLRHVAKHHDVEMRQALRGRQLLYMCAANAVLGLVAIVALHGFGFVPTYPVALVVGAFPPPIVAFFLLWRRSEHSPVSSRLLASFLVMTLVALFMRGMGWRFGVPLHATIAFELCMDTLAALITSILVDRRLLRPALFCTVCSSLAIVFPLFSITLLLVGVTLGLTWAALIWAREATREPAPVA